MKKLEIEISKCDDCPYCTPQFGFHENMYFWCDKTQKKITNIRSIPNFCPLEDTNLVAKPKNNVYYGA